MSNEKQYVDLRVKDGKKGKYLSGKLRGSDTIFMVFKDGEGDEEKNVLFSKDGFKGDLNKIDTFTDKEGDYGPYELAKNAATGETYFLKAREDAGDLVFYKKGDREGAPVLIDVWKDGAKTGEQTQLVSADFTLTIAAKRD